MILRSIFLGVTATVALPGVAAAQWVPASELMGQPLQVTTNGVSNTVYLDAGGAARIVTPGGRAIPASWTAANGQLCLNNGTASECWPYAAPFQANQPVTLASSCNSTSTWLAQAVNAPPPPPAAQRGERGR
jgi:hypothetical protein